MRVSEFMGYLKGKNALMIYDKHPELQSKQICCFSKQKCL